MKGASRGSKAVSTNASWLGLNKGGSEPGSGQMSGGRRNGAEGWSEVGREVLISGIVQLGTVVAVVRQRLGGAGKSKRGRER